MGVRVPTNLAITLDVGLREDSVLAAIRALGPNVEQVLIIGEHPFLKRVVEAGTAANINWPGRNVSLITGGEVMPENFRSYVGGLLGHDDAHPERGQILVSLGISEVGLSVAQETPDLRRLRRLMHRDPVAREAVLGPCPFVPTLAQFFPQQYYIETIDGAGGRPELVITTLDRHRMIPLVRYATGDWARIITHDQLRSGLEKCGRPSELPKSRLPVLAMWGRGRCLRIGQNNLFPEQIKEGIYSDPQLARALTGAFVLDNVEDQLNIRFQLEIGISPDQVLRDKAHQVLHEWVAAGLQVELVSHREFAASMELSYIRKFRYL